MSGRTRFLTHRGKQILLIDLSHCSAAEAEKIIRGVPEIVTAKPRGSVLILTDYTGATVDEEVLRTVQESAVFDKPFVKRSAWIGAQNLPAAFYEKLKKFSGREFPTFKSREEALEWLTTD